MIVLITGPVRSGKSTRAVRVARDLGLPVTHVLTARVDPTDREMADRIARHRAERGTDTAIEVWAPGTPALAEVVGTEPAGRTFLVDSLGTWVAGHLLDIEDLAERDAHAAALALERFTDPLPAALSVARCHVVIVAEETGWGLVPVSAQGRIFRDHLGRLTQAIGRIAERVELVAAGYAIDLRRVGTPVWPADISARPRTSASNS